MKRWLFLPLVVLFGGCGLVVRQATIAYIAVETGLTGKQASIEINRSFIETYKNRVTIQTTFTADASMSEPLPKVLDGDLHFAGRAPQVALPIVAEIADAAEHQAAIDVVTQFAGTKKSLRVSGVWRIWPEHAGRAREEQGKHLRRFDTDNPSHVFELHPVTRIGRISLLDSFKPIDGFVPGDAERTFGIFQDAKCTLHIKPQSVVIDTEKGLYNDVEFVMKIAGDRQLVVRDGRFVIASALDLHGKVLVERLRMVFTKGTRPEETVKQLHAGDQLHVFGIPRLDFAELSERIKSERTDAQVTRPLPYEILILGVYPK